VVRTFSPKAARQTEMLEGSPDELARQLVDRLDGLGALARGGA